MELGLILRTRRPGWWWAENEVLDEKAEKIGCYALGVYCYLCRHSYAEQAELTIREMARKLHISRSTVERSMEVLVAEKMVAIVESNRGAGLPNIYALLPITTERREGERAASVGSSPEASGYVSGEHAATPPQKEPIRNKTNKTKNKENPASVPDAVPYSGLHQVVIDAIDKAYMAATGIKCPWSNTLAFKYLKDLLTGNRSWTEEQWLACVRNRFASEGINPAADPVEFVKKLPSFVAGPLNRFGGRLELQNGQGKTGSHNRIDRNREAATEAARRIVERDQQAGREGAENSDDAHDN